MRRVVIESPFGKNVDGSTADETTMLRNVAYLRAAIADCLRRGEAPFASHGLYPGALEDGIPEERRLGMEAGWEWMTAAHAVVVYVDHGVTPGMRGGIARAEALGLKIEERSIHYATPAIQGGAP